MSFSVQKLGEADDTEFDLIHDIDEASKVLKENATVTDVRNLKWLERIAGREVYGKFENQQVTGSFKFRGAFYRLSKQDTNRGVIAASAGNHGLAIAEAGQRLGVDTTICIPTTASSAKKARISGYNHRIIQEGGSLEEATNYAKKIASDQSLDFISPYNDPRIIAGQGSLAREFLEQVPHIEAMIVPAGGGGLIAGIGLMAKNINPNIKIIGVQPVQYASFATSFATGAVRRVNNFPTFADGLAVNLEENSITLDIAKKVVDEVVLVTEEEIVAATLALIHHESQLIEPSGAIALAALIAGKLNKIPEKIGMVFSGGNVTTSTISRVMHYPFRTPHVIDFINLHGQKVKHQPTLRGIDFSKEKAEENDSYDNEVDEDVAFLTDRFRDIFVTMNDIRSRLDEYLAYCDNEGLRQDDSAVQTIQDLQKLVEKRLKEILPLKLTEDLSATDYNKLITSYLQAYRSLIHLILSASLALDWRSAAYGQSVDSMFFHLSSQRNPGVNYNRYESSRVASLEKQMTKIMAFDGAKTAVLMTSSGMAAYALIESYLVRNVLKPGDKVFIPHYIYFETDEQIGSVPNVEVVRMDTHNTNEIVAYIKHHKPKVVFFDPMTNTLELRMTDVRKVIECIGSDENELEDDIFFVIDGTMISGEMNAFSASENPKVKILYMDSCSKYLQLGLDISMGGLVAVPTNLFPMFDRLRRNTGTIMYDSGSNIFPNYDRQTHLKRMRRFHRNAKIIGSMVESDPAVSSQIIVRFPGMVSHPDYQVASQYDSIGGIMTFEFNNPFLNQRDSLNSFIEIVLVTAKECGISLTKGVSFGFSLPRISAAAAMAENAPPFLRLSVGDRSEKETRLLAQAFITALKQFISTSEYHLTNLYD